MRRFYLDTNATYGVAPEVSEFLSAAKNFTYLNPSSISLEGQRVRAEVDAVRRELYSVLDISEQDYHLVFTSGATEANNAAIFSSFWNKIQDGWNVVTSNVEHSSVVEPLARIEERGVEVRRIGPVEDPDTFVKDFLGAIDKDTKLVSLMWANNETGQLFPVPEIFQEIRERSPSCVLHTDAVQVFAKIPLELKSFPFDFLSCSPHKFGGLPGSGFCLIQKRLPLSPLSLGGAQEGKWRPGTENTLGILSLFNLISKIKEQPSVYQDSTRAIRDSFERTITERFPEVSVIAKDALRLPNTSLIHFPDLRSDDLLVNLDLAGIACSAGSACSSGKALGTETVRQMGYPEKTAKEVIRFSFPADFNKKDLHEVVTRIIQVVERAKSTSSELGAGASGSLEREARL